MAYKSICDEYGDAPMATLIGAPLVVVAVTAMFNPLSHNVASLVMFSGICGFKAAFMAEVWAKNRAYARQMGATRSSRFIQRAQLGAAILTTGSMIGAAGVMEYDHRTAQLAPAPMLQRVSQPLPAAPAPSPSSSKPRKLAPAV